jgi:hypothetical protein
MILTMDTREIPSLLIHCANAHLPVEVLQVRVNSTATLGRGTVSKGADVAITPAKSGDEENSDLRKSHVPVVIHGIIYIFNPPDMTKLAPPAEEGAAPAVPAAGAPPAAAAPAAPTAAPSGNTVPGSAAPGSTVPGSTPAPSPVPGTGPPASGSPVGGSPVGGAPATGPPATGLVPGTAAPVATTPAAPAGNSSGE